MYSYMRCKIFQLILTSLIFVCGTALAYDLKPPSDPDSINLKCSVSVDGVQKTAFIFIQQQKAGVRESLQILNERGEEVESVEPGKYSCNYYGCSRATEAEGYVDSISITDNKIKFESKPYEGIYGRGKYGSFVGEIDRASGRISISRTQRKPYYNLTGTCDLYNYVPPKTKF